MKKIYLNLFVAATVFLFSPTISARNIIFNVNNNNAAGNLYERNENVVVGDVIVFVNNLNYSITNVANTMRTVIIPGALAEQKVTVASNSAFQVPVMDQTITEYYFIHDNYQQNRYYNNRLRLTFPALETKSFFSNEEFQMTSANPVEEKVVGKFAEIQSKVKIELFDLDGKTIKKQELTASKEFEIELSELEKGMYLLNIESDNRKIVKKLLKK